jgi:hypothetical protein
MSAQQQKLVADQEISRPRRLATYQRDWGAHITSIQSCVATGMTMGELVRAHAAHIGDYRGFLPAGILRRVSHLDLGKFADEKPPHRLAVIDGRYRSSPTGPSTEALIDAVAQCVDADVDCIVEFGSGLGFNLARLRLRLPSAPLTYIACEPTAAGREAARSLFASDRDARFAAREFDYLRPDLDFLAGFRKIVAFTVHSVEQVAVLGEDFYRRLLAANIAACVHVEPVGWQRFTNIAETVAALHYHQAAGEQFIADYRFVVEDARVVDNAAIWAAYCAYNTDLLRLVSAAVARGEVSLIALAYEVVGLNPFNPSTLVAWRRNRAFA